ncbi:MAG: InlB B-repeat-containing protein, partial [Christensenellales bacterium]|nr:InlB B-repeat-containing protein [Christensenellales bacterium]
MKIRLKNLCLALVALMCLVLLSSCGSAPQPKQSVASMEDIGIKAQPKTAYILGDPFDVSAGVLNLFYDDGTIKELPFTAEGVTISVPDMETVGTKTVNVDYDGFKVSYMITIETQKYAVSFDLNYAGASAPAVQMVETGAYAARPSDPVREGYRFGGWYADANATTAFDFSAAAITGDVTVYAAWTAVYSVTFDLNDGASQATTVVVDAGTPIQEMMAPAAAREGYEFAKWHTDPEADTPYDFTQAVSADVVLY